MLAPLIVVIVGVTGFILGQAILKFVLEPIVEQRKLIGEIAAALTEYANVGGIRIPEDADRVNKAQTAIRGMASRLRASPWSLPFYEFFASRQWVKTKDITLKASVVMISWSNTLYGDSGDMGKKDEIAELLGIDYRTGAHT